MEEQRIYEIGYLIISSLPEEGMQEEVSWLKKLLESVKAEVIAEGAAEKRDLAYSIKKKLDGQYRTFDSAYFGWIKVAVDAAATEKLNKELTLRDPFLRYMITTTVRESTLAPEKLYVKDEKPEGATEEVAPEEVAVEAPAPAVEEKA